MNMFVVSSKSRYHPYGSDYKSTLTAKFYGRSIISKPLSAPTLAIPSRLPRSAQRFNWSDHSIKFNEGQKNALDVLCQKLETGAQFFHMIGGFAGAGKTVVLREFVERVRRFHHYVDSCFVGAPTANAAQLVDGMTIHSLLKFFPGEAVFKKLNEVDLGILYQKLQRMRVLVIDEVSLLTCVMFAQIDQRLREVFGSDLPFGGISIVLFGDLLQLPAVSTLTEKKVRNGQQWDAPVSQCIYDAIPSRYSALHSAVTPNLKDYLRLFFLFELDELTENVRNKSKLEGEILEEIRQGVKSERIEDYLYSKCRMQGSDPSDVYREVRRLRADDPAGDYMILAGTNEKVDSINDWISEHSSRVVVIEPKAECPGGCATYVRYGKKKRTLRLVVGGRIMVTDNHSTDRTLVNGITGRLLEIKEDHLVMKRIDNNKKVYIGRFPYKLNKCAREVWYQFPVVMAEAITVHKSQGMTFDGVVIDSDSIKTCGGQYTALSRARSLTKVRITNVRRLNYWTSRDSQLALERMRERTSRRRRPVKN